MPKSLSRRLPRDISVHGLLAADLALDSSDTYAAWNAVCPTPADFASMPLHWPPALQELLPGPARVLLARQRAKIERDWAAASKLFLSSTPSSPPSSSPSSPSEANGDDTDKKTKEAAVAYASAKKQRFIHAWLLVNTRTFYHESPRLRRRAKEDRMVLQPVADLFNHAGSRTGWCHVAFDAASFTVRADRRYAAGDEVRICYGRHGGDLLLVEYGFVLGSDSDEEEGEEAEADWLEENCWDEVGLDDVLLPRLSDSAKDKLSEVGFLGGYVLDAGTVCYRTQVALRALCCLPAGREEEWRRFLEDGEDADVARQGEIDQVFVNLLEEYRVQTIGKTIAKVTAMDADDDEEEREEESAKKSSSSTKAQRELLCKRWRHVDRLVRITIKRLKGEIGMNKTH